MNKELADARTDIDAAMETGPKPAADPAMPDTPAPDGEALPIASSGGAGATTAPLNGAGHAPEPAVAGADEAKAPETQKSGV